MLLHFLTFASLALWMTTCCSFVYSFWHHVHPRRPCEQALLTCVGKEMQATVTINTRDSKPVRAHDQNVFDTFFMKLWYIYFIKNVWYIFFDKHTHTYTSRTRLLHHKKIRTPVLVRPLINFENKKWNLPTISHMLKQKQYVTVNLLV